MGVPRPALVISILVAVLAAGAAVAGIGYPELYRDNAFTTSTWLGTDLATLVLAVPLLVASLAWATRGSMRAYLIWLGVLDAVLYNFAFYLFGTAFNVLFLVYAAVVGLSIWGLVYGIVGLDADRLALRFSPKTPVRSIGSFMIFVGGGLASVYVAQWAVFSAAGQLPPIIAMTGHPTNVVFALDLTLVVPVLLVGAAWLWRRRPWGYVLATVINVKGAVYLAGLCAATITAYRAGTVETLSELALWGPLGLGCLVSAVVLLGNLKPEPE